MDRETEARGGTQGQGWTGVGPVHCRHQLLATWGAQSRAFTQLPRGPTGLATSCLSLPFCPAGHCEKRVLLRGHMNIALTQAGSPKGSGQGWSVQVQATSPHSRHPSWVSLLLHLANFYSFYKAQVSGAFSRQSSETSVLAPMADTVPGSSHPGQCHRCRAQAVVIELRQS